MSHPNTGVLASPSWHYCDQPGLYFQKQVPRTGTCRGVVDPVCCTWGHGEFPLAWDSKPPAHPTPYTLLPTGRNQGHVSSKGAMICSSMSSSPNCPGVGPWHIPRRTSASHSDSWWAFQMRMLERTEISPVWHHWACWLWGGEGLVKSHNLCV